MRLPRGVGSEEVEPPRLKLFATATEAKEGSRISRGAASKAGEPSPRDRKPSIRRMLISMARAHKGSAPQIVLTRLGSSAYSRRSTFKERTTYAKLQSSSV